MITPEIKILAVDDIYDNLISLKALILEAFPSAQVVFAQSGSEAIETALRINPDVILLDVVMPDMDGYETCKVLKNNSVLRDIPVVFITALKADKEGRIKALEVGAEAFLAKPIDESELVAQIRAMSKVGYLNKLRRTEQEHLNNIVSEKTLQLELNNVATLNLLEDLQKEVDARRQTESNLIRSEARLRRAELASRSGNWEYDPYSKRVHMSEGAVFLFGFDKNEVDFSTFLSVFEESERPNLDTSIHKLVSENHPFNYEVKVTALGSSESIYVRLFAIKEKDDEVVFGIVRNITENKTIREHLRESEQKYRSIFENSPVGIMYYNKEGRIVDCNKNFVNIIGSSHKAIMNLDLTQLKDNQLTKCMLNSLNGEEAVYEGLYNSETASKSTFVRATFKPISFIDRGIVGGVGIVWDLTERKRAEEIIIRSEAEYRSVWENSVNALRLSDRNGIILRANDAFCQLFEVSQSEIVGKLVSDIYFSDTREENFSEYQYKFEHNYLDSNFEKKLVLLNGKNKWVEINKSFIEVQGKQKLLLTVFNEITTRKKAEIELQTALDRNHALLMANPDMMFLFNKNHRIIDYKAESKLYIQPDKFKNRKVEDVLPSKLAEITKLNIDKVLSTRENIHHTYDLETDGELNTFEARYVPCGDDVLSIIRDITATVKTQRALLESESKFRFLMDNSPEGITIYVDGKIAYINKEALRIIGAVEKEQVMGRSLFEFIHPDNLDLILERMKIVAQTPFNTSLPAIEERYMKLDGSYVDVEIKVMPIYYEGKPAVQISGHDITKQKQAREELERNRIELKAIYDNAPVMMCVVNEDAEILFANSALTSFIDSPEILSSDLRTCGNVLGCFSAFEKEEGCGNGERCKNCNLRWALTDTFLTGAEHKNIDYQTTILKDNTSKEIALLASTSLIQKEGEKRLLLCMSDISDRLKAQKELLDYQKMLRDFAAHLQSVREEERINLAREIHDDLGQILVAIKFDIGMLGVKSKKFIREEAADEFKSKFKRLEEYVNDTIKSARRIMTNLRPELLDMVCLVDAFKEHIKVFNERQNIVCDFINNANVISFPSEKSVALFRILQESLNNASKYSEANQIIVELNSDNDKFYMDITDDGIGFDISTKKRNDSYGLLGMRERAYLLEGRVDISSEPGKGTRIHVEVPLPKSDIA